MTREQWLSGIRSCIEPVGECMEWTGPVRGSVPLVYTPAGYAWSGNANGRQSVRCVLYALSNGTQLPAGTVIRSKCRNSRCVHEDHFQFFKRTEQAAEQGRRGELSTPGRCAARAKSARARSTLTLEKVAAIRASDLSDSDEAQLHGVTEKTIEAIRLNKRWRTVVSGASVFSWGGVA